MPAPQKWTVPRRWGVAAPEVEFVPMVLDAWDWLPTVAPDATALLVAHVLLAEWQRGVPERGGGTRFQVRRTALARATKLSTRSTSAALARLERAGLLARTKTGPRRSTVYDLSPMLRRVPWGSRVGNDVPRSSGYAASPLADRVGKHVPHSEPDRGSSSTSPGTLLPQSLHVEERARALEGREEDRGAAFVPGDARSIAIEEMRAALARPRRRLGGDA